MSTKLPILSDLSTLILYLFAIFQNPADRDNLGDETKYAPTGGFPLTSFPYRNQKGYQAPLVFARLESLKSGVTVQVSCKVWARNVYHHKNDRAGSAHFEILMD